MSHPARKEDGYGRDTATKRSAPPGVADAPQDLFAELLDTMDQGLVAIDSSLNILAVNRRAGDLLDLPTELLRNGADFATVIGHAVERGDYGPGDPSEQTAHYVALASGAEPYSFERVRPDGAIIEIRGNPRPGGGFVITYTDITNRVSSESALDSAYRVLEDKRRQIDIALDNMSQGLTLYDANQRLVLANRRYREIFNLGDDQVLPGMTLREILEHSLAIGNYEDQTSGNAAMEKRLAVARSRERTTLRQFLTGDRVVEVIHQPLPDGGAVATFNEISSRVRAESEILTARKHAEIANRTKSEFLANMSHELRTPLNAIIGFSEILRHELMGPLGDPQYREYAADIHDSGIHLLSVINDILDLSKIEAGKLELMEETFEVATIVAAAMRLVKERAAAAGLSLFAELAENLPRLKADARAVKQMLLNLLANAIKFTPAGGKVSVRASLDGDGWLNIAVIDTGIGMQRNEIPKALSAFGQIDSSLARTHEGTGLGLPLVKSLVELHGGELTIDSELGNGTIVTINMPPERVIERRPG